MMDQAKFSGKPLFFKSLAYKLLRTSLLIAVIFGVLSAIVQVSFDFSEQKTIIDDRVEDIFRVTGNSAQHAVHLLDDQIADEVVKGLEHYSFISKAIIYDDSDHIMAQYRLEPAASSTLWITELVSNTSKEYIQELAHTDGVVEGSFLLVINIDNALASFYDRALTIFISGFIRNAGLAVVLLGLYYLLLTKPLVGIARQVSAVNPDKPDGRRLESLPKHRDDELGLIVTAINGVLHTLEGQRLKLHERGKQLNLILDSSPNLIYAVNQAGDLVFLNKTAANFYNCTIEQLIGQCWYKQHKKQSEDEANNLLLLFKQTESREDALFERDQCMTDCDGLQRTMQASFISFSFNNEICVLVVANDITGRVNAERRVENLAYFDTLTGLPNRNLLYDRVAMDISRCEREGNYGALLYIDLDEFKRVNDTLGHTVGDQLLVILSQSMGDQIRQTDTLARLGGDEFTLSLPDLSADFEAAKAQAAELAGRLLVKLSQPVTLGNNEFNVSASIGVMMYPYNNEGTDTLLRFADTAMYKAKQGGRNAYMVFEPSMAVEADRLAKLEVELRLAIKERQFTFHLQPLINASDGSLSGAEALVRWRHPERGLIPPFDFLEHLENSGMISEVDRLVFKGVCAFAVDHYRRGLLPSKFRFSINLSAKELHRTNFVDDVRDALEKTGLPAKHLEFEVTESAALLNIEEVVQKIKTLQGMGITFALDDFGTGYSSLSYLKQLPVNKVKIDKSFINDLTVDRQDEALVASVVAIAKTLDLVTVAEGVETQDQVDWFSKYENIIFQGYLFDRPLPSEDFSKKYLAAKVGIAEADSVVELRPRDKKS